MWRVCCLFCSALALHPQRSCLEFSPIPRVTMATPAGLTHFTTHFSYLLQQPSHYHVCALFFFSHTPFLGAFFYDWTFTTSPPPPPLPLRNFGPRSKILNQLQAAAAAAAAEGTVGPLRSVFLTPRADLWGSRCMRKTGLTVDSSSERFCLWSPTSAPPEPLITSCSSTFDSYLSELSAGSWPGRATGGNLQHLQRRSAPLRLSSLST